MTVVNDSIDVSDNFATPGSTSDDKHWTDIDETTTLSYAQAFTCGGTSGSAGFTNIASIDGTAKTASWTVQVTLRRQGDGDASDDHSAARLRPRRLRPRRLRAATTPPPAVAPPFTPPVAKPKPKPKPKAEKAPAVLTIVTVAQKAIPAGKKAKVTIRLTAAGKPVAGARVRLRRPGDQ